MKKVLIISYYYGHPTNVGGAVRVQKFVKYLPQFGWQPVVLTTPVQLPDTPQGPGGPQFFAATPGCEVRGHPIVSSYLWLPAAIRAATEIVEREGIDIILANCDPFVASLVAVHVSQRCNIPVVADFRDAWSFNPYSRGPRWISKFLESYVMRRIHFLITTSPGNTDEYIARYRFLASKIQTLYNGFDEEDFPRSRPTAFDRFTIASAGTLSASRMPHVLFEALQQLADRAIQLVLMGSATGDILGLAAEYQIGDRVEFLGRMAQRDAIREIHRAQMLLVMQGATNMRCTPIAGKTFEYIRTGLPILAVAPEGNNVAFLREHAPQAYIVTSFSADEVADSIERCYQSWKAGSTGVQRNAVFEDAFNRRELTRQLGELLDRVLAMERRN